MSLEPAQLVRLGLLGLQGALLVVVFLSLPMHRRRPGMEISAMIMCLVAVGPVGDLFQDALRTDRPWADAWAPWADLGLLVGITQALFWTSLWQMRKHDSGAAKPTVGSAS